VCTSRRCGCPAADEGGVAAALWRSCASFGFVECSGVSTTCWWSDRSPDADSQVRSGRRPVRRSVRPLTRLRPGGRSKGSSDKRLRVGSPLGRGPIVRQPRKSPIAAPARRHAESRRYLCKLRLVPARFWRIWGRRALRVGPTSVAPRVRAGRTPTIASVANRSRRLGPAHECSPSIAIVRRRLLRTHLLGDYQRAQGTATSLARPGRSWSSASRSVISPRIRQTLAREPRDS
jgi:hypothetical protein